MTLGAPAQKRSGVLRLPQPGDAGYGASANPVRRIHGTAAKPASAADDAMLGNASASEANSAANVDEYVITKGGVVQNAPSLTVFDLDILDSPSTEKYAVEDVLDLREAAVLHGATDLVESFDKWLGDLAPLGDERVHAVTEEKPYVLMEGGIVQNHPGIPVLDLDVLEDSADEDSIYEVRGHRETAAKLGLYDIVEECDEWLEQAGL